MNLSIYGYMPAYAGIDHVVSERTNKATGFNKTFPGRVSISFDTVDHDPSADFKVLMQAESPTIYQALTQKILDNYKTFDLILTYDDRLLHLPNSQEFLGVTNWVLPQPNIAKKPLLTFLISSKRITPSHLFRFKAFDTVLNATLQHGMERWCHRSPPRLEPKDEIFKGAMFHVALENQKMSNMFTEKLLDCFVTKTVPIYYGCNNIGKYFDTNGIIQINDDNDLQQVVEILSPDLYYQMLPSIEQNFELAKTYTDYSVYERIENIIIQAMEKKYAGIGNYSR